MGLYRWRQQQSTLKKMIWNREANRGLEETHNYFPLSPRGSVRGGAGKQNLETHQQHLPLTQMGLQRTIASNHKNEDDYQLQ